MRILVADKLADEGLDFIRQSGMEFDAKIGLKEDQLAAETPNYDAMIVRSGAKVTAKVLTNPGKLKAIATTGNERAQAFPNLPTLAEHGMKLEANTWFGLFGPAGLPADVTQRLNRAFVDALGSPELKARLSALLAEPSPTTPAEFAAFVRRELSKYERVVKASGAKLD